MAIRMVIADDHEVVRSGLASLLKGTDIKIVAEATNGKQAVRAAVKQRPDVVLLEIRMSQGDGLYAVKKIHEQLPNTQIIVFSTYDNPTYVARAIALGASDYVLKRSSRRQLISAINGAAAGQSPSPAGLVYSIAATMKKRDNVEHTDIPLTNRETQVLRHLALGLSNREIGLSLEISIETVKEHVQNILRKLNLNDRTQAAVWAVHRELA